ncbi:MAG: cob(I)yrinic acid a,c-diamide adenosyltransferase [Deltaproteobacteria bacterium]
MKIYTGTGDRGITSLFSGERVPKDNTRVDAYGDIDELNSILGALAASLSDKEALIAELHQIQSTLMQLSAWLATHPDSALIESLEEITDEQIGFLEDAIDRLQKGLPVLKGFILPTGHITASLAHVARTVCRRSERKVVPLLNKVPDGKAGVQYRKSLVYLNRLSDYLFVLARHCNHVNGFSDKLWKK